MMAKEHVRYRDEDGSTLKDWVPYKTVTFTIDISDDDNLSDAVDCSGYRIAALRMPAALTSTAITFTECETADGTFLAVYAGESAVSETVAASHTVSISTNAEALSGLKYVKLAMGSSEAADRTIKAFLVAIV